MPSPCATCEHPQRREIERQSRAGVPATTLAAWTRSTPGGYVSRLALGRHLREHMGLGSKPGRRPVSDDFAAAVRDRAHERLAEGDLEPTLRDGLLATQVIDRRAERQADRDLTLRIAAALTGVAAPFQLPDANDSLEAERVVMEGTFRELLEAGT